MDEMCIRGLLDIEDDLNLNLGEVRITFQKIKQMSITRISINFDSITKFTFKNNKIILQKYTNCPYSSKA